MIKSKNLVIIKCLFYVTLLLPILAFGQVSYEPDSTFYYKTTKQGKLKMDVFKPKNHKASDKRPVALFFFGGGWTGGSTKQFYQQARCFSEKGILAISAQYRVSGKHKTSPFESVSDGKSAIRWVREHALELGIDPDRVIASGGSAGGHVAACTGVISDYDEAGENFAISSIPNVMILFNPVIDTTEKGYGLKKVGEERKTEISPCHHVTSGIPSTLIFHGTTDKTVPFENVERFSNLMRESDNFCELIAFPNKGHGFFNGTFFRNSNTDDDFNITMEKSMNFLVKLNIIAK